MPPWPLRRGGAVWLAPVVSGLGAAVSLLLPPAAPLFLPGAAARVARAAFRSRRIVWAFPLAAAVVPCASLFGLIGGGAGALLSPLVALVFVSLPALALVAGARDGRRRDELALLVGAVTAIGLLSVLLGFSISGTDPGAALAARVDQLLPELIAAYRKSGWSESTIEAATSALGVFHRVLAGHLVGIVLSAAALYGALVVYPFGRLSGLAERDVAPGGFASFRTPVAVTAAFVPAGAVAALGSGVAARAAVDVLAVLAVLFFLRGLAIIRALLDRGRAGLLIRVPVYVLALQMPIPLLVAFGGLLDEFFDFRRKFGGGSAGAGDADREVQGDKGDR